MAGKTIHRIYNFSLSKEFIVEIITCVCIDKSPENSKDKYITLPRTNSAKRRQLFWQCAAVFYASSIRCNPTYKHILYTNDQDHVFFDRLDLNKLLIEIGVEIRYLPFEKFDPPQHLTKLYRNTYYRAEVIHSLSPDKSVSSIILDSDCLWTKPIDKLDVIFNDGHLLVIDTYHEKDVHAKVMGISRTDLGNLYRGIYSGYPTAHPIWFGGDFIGGQNYLLRFVGEEIEKVFNIMISDFEKASLKLPNGLRLLDVDEYVLSYAINKFPKLCRDATPFFCRIWTINNKVLEREWNAPIWHLPLEKQVGFPMLLSKVVDSSSKFWSTPIDGFADYLGGFVGVPRRKQFSWKATELEFRSRTKDIVRRAMSPFGSGFRQEFNS
jgi:hypothetical protein